MAIVGERTTTSLAHETTTNLFPHLGARASRDSSTQIRAQISDVLTPMRNQTTGSELTIELLKEKTGLTDDHLDQPIPEYSLFDIASRIPNWSDYAGSQGMELSEGEMQSVREDPSRTMTRMKAQRALELWHGRDPYKATYRSLLNMCLKRKDGDVARKIVNEVILEVDAPISAPVTTTVVITTSTGPATESESLYKHVDSQKKLQHPVGKNLDEMHLASKTLTLVKKDFVILYSSLRIALKKLGVSASDLLSHLRDMETFGPETEPVLTSQHSTLLTAMNTTVKRCPTIDDVFHLMAPYCSWFNHLLIESIIEVFFQDRSHFIHGKFKEFKKKFEDYCQTRHFPLEDFGPDEVDGTTSVVFKIDHHWESIQVRQLVNVQTALATALTIRRANLLLRTVKNGCLELTVAMPTHLAREIFPLPENAILPLNECKTISFKYEQYSCNVPETAREINEKLHNIGDSIDRRIAAELKLAFQNEMHSMTSGKLAGIMLAQLGRRITTEFLDVPIYSFFICIAGSFTQFFCFAVPYGMNAKVRIVAGIFGSLCSAGLTYYIWRRSPRNISVRRMVFVNLFTLLSQGALALTNHSGSELLPVVLVGLLLS